MKLKMTNIKRGTIAIFDEDMKVVALDLNGEMARLLFFDHDRTLLAAAENEALKAGKMMMVYDFCSQDQDAKDFLKENGFKTEETEEIYSVSIGDLFSRGVVSRTASLKADGYKWIPLRDLIFYQAMELIDVFGEQDIPISTGDLLMFNNDLSGVVYDSEGKIAAYNLLSGYDDGLMFECLNSHLKTDSEPLYTALSGIAKEMEGCNINERFENLYLYDIDNRKMSMAKELVDGACDISPVYTTLCARKILKRKSIQDESTKVIMDFDAEQTLNRITTEKIFAIPFQNNINWKSNRTNNWR